MDYKFFDISDRTISFNFSDNIDQIINSKIVEISLEINKKRDYFDIRYMGVALQIDLFHYLY